MFKSRQEKRRNWKEKNKLLKELDAKFLQEDTDIKNDDQTAAEEEEEETTPSEKIEEKSSQKPKVTQKTEKITKPVVVKRKVEELTESESESESEPEMSQAEQDSVNESDNNISDESDSEEDEDEDSEEDEEPISYDNSIVGDFTLPIKETKNTTELKPLVIANKPSHMEIRQINLDELKDMSELPIEAKTSADHASNSDVNNNKKKMMKNDAFFLDSNGNEVHSSTRFDPGLDQAQMDDESYYYGGGRRNWNNQTNYSQARRDYGASSSFKSSLDANKSSSYSNNYRNYNNKQENVNNRGFSAFFFILDILNGILIYLCYYVIKISTTEIDAEISK